jgi:hypothetical protein
MLHGHGVDNCCIHFGRKGGKFPLEKSRSPTQIFQQNLVSASHQMWAYVCKFSLGLMEIMAMAMAMAMVLVIVIVIIVPESRFATSTSASKLFQT